MTWRILRMCSQLSSKRSVRIITIEEFLRSVFFQFFATFYFLTFANVVYMTSNFHRSRSFLLLKCYLKILDIAHIFWMWHSSKEKNTFYNLSNFKSNLLSEDDVIAEILCNFSGRLFSHKFQKFHWFYCNYFKKCWNQHPILRLLKCNLLRESRWNECPTLP